MTEAMVHSQVVELEKMLEHRADVMKRHRVFGLVRTMEDLHVFMTWHVFAVWDFMSLLKRLQIEYTTTKLPWYPTKRPQAARLINEIVLGEESDDAPGDQHCSHYELYLAAMEEVGAPTQKVRQFVELISANMSVEDALRLSGAPVAVREFVQATVDLSINGSVEEVLGSFLYGREESIPAMFRNLLDTWKIDEADAPTFVFYLNRHIQLDTDSHGPAALQLMRDQLGDNEEAKIRLLSSAIAAVNHRIQLWDALASVLAASAKSNMALAEQVA